MKCLFPKPPQIYYRGPGWYAWRHPEGESSRTIFFDVASPEEAQVEGLATPQWIEEIPSSWVDLVKASALQNAHYAERMRPGYGKPDCL